MYFTLVLKEVAIVLLLLTLFAILLYTLFLQRGEVKERSKRLDGIAERLLEEASDDKPIMLNVSQERLIGKVADEIERRNSLRRES